MAANKATRILYQNNKRGKLGRKTVILGVNGPLLSVNIRFYHANFTELDKKLCPGFF